MARAILSLEGDPAQLRSVLSGLRSDSRTTAEAVRGDFQKMGEAASQAYRRMAGAAARNRAKVVEEEQRITDAVTSGAQRRKTIAEAEGNYRTNAARQAETAAVRAEQMSTAVTVRESRRRTQTLRSEANERQRIAREWGRRGEAAAGRIMSAGGQIYGMVTGERPRAASIQRSVGNAVYQAGGNFADVQATTGAVQRFARERGLDATELASALQGAQTEFSVLGNSRTSAADRNRNLEQFLQSAALGQSTGNDVGEFTRLAGLFNDSGITGNQQRQMLMFAAGAAQRGAVEVGGVTREAMAAMRSRMGAAASRARRDGTDPVAAMQREFRQAFAEVEVARSSGETTRGGGNAMASLSRALTAPAVSDKLLNNIQQYRAISSEQRTQLMTSLFEDDPTRRGQRRLRTQMQNPLAMIEAFGAAGIDQSTFMNLTRGGGHGNPLSLLENQRRVVGSLLNTDAEGRSGLTRVREIMNTGALSEADVRRGEGIFTQDRQATLNKEQEARSMALTDNTSAVVRLTESLNRTAAESPMLAPFAELGAEFLGSRVGRAAGTLLGGVRRGGAALGGLVTGAATLLMPSNAGEAAVSEQQLIRAHEAAGGGRVGAEAARLAMGGGAADLTALRNAVRDGTREGLATTAVRIADNPHADAQGRARGASGSPPPAP
jgi:hypothetical protein